jgi:hypothetical protein
MNEDRQEQSNPSDTVVETSTINDSENFEIDPSIAARRQHPVVDLYYYFGQVWMLPLAIMLAVMSVQQKKGVPW